MNLNLIIAIVVILAIIAVGAYVYFFVLNGKLPGSSQQNTPPPTTGGSTVTNDTIQDISSDLIKIPNDSVLDSDVNGLEADIKAF